MGSDEIPGRLKASREKAPAAPGGGRRNIAAATRLDPIMQIDEVDRKIIHALNENARKSYRDIAKELGVALSTVSNRIKRLEEEGVLTAYVPVVDPELVGLPLAVIVGIRIAHGKLREVEEVLAADPRVMSVYDVTGEWDCMILARFKDRNDLDDFIKGVLSHKYVERTNTQLVLNTVKDDRRVAV